MHTFFEIIDRFKRLTAANLSGFDSHIKMAPTIRGVSFRNFAPSGEYKKSAVLILLSKQNNDVQILFTLRSEKLNSHKGQISFPGGRMEDGESPAMTALRETFEETGIEPSLVHVICELSPLFVPPSKSLITPILAYVDSPPEIKINPDEVEDYFWLSIETLLDVASLRHEESQFEDKLVTIPFWDVHPKSKLWGATSMILREFLDIYEIITQDEA
jgi:8-oxo-dGTP pyrophosphatase MutT (NUDIX family)